MHLTFSVVLRWATQGSISKDTSVCSYHLWFTLYTLRTVPPCHQFAVYFTDIGLMLSSKPYHLLCCEGVSDMLKNMMLAFNSQPLYIYIFVCIVVKPVLSVQVSEYSVHVQI